MSTHTRTTAALALAALLSVSLAACSSSAGTSSAPASAAASTVPAASAAPGSSTAAGAATLAISGFSFSALSVAAGATVTVSNADAVDHTVKVAGTDIDVKVPGGGTATFTAPAAGTYALTCDFHPDMKGTLTVT